MRRLLKIAISAYLLLLSALVHGQTARIYTSGRDLPSSQINSIRQDSNGFIWIATENGLARFNGRDFQTYQYDRNKTGGLASNLVLGIFQDSAERLWAATSSGLQLINPENDSFSSIDLKDPQVPSSNQHISSIIEVPVKGATPELWVGCSQWGIYILDHETLAPKAARRQAVNSSLPSLFISRLFMDSRGYVWVACETGGLCVMDSRSASPLSDIWDDETFPISREIVVTDMAEEASTGEIVISTSNYGLLIFEPSTRKIRRSRGPRARECMAMSLLRNKSHARAGEKLFLVGTEDSGLKVYDLESDVFRDAHIDNFSMDISNLKIHSLLEDSQGNIWVGAYQTGVFVIPHSMYGFMHTPLAGDGLFSSSATSLACDGDLLWVGTDGGGLCKVEKGGKTSFYTSSNSALTNNSIMDVTVDGSGTLWIATYQDGLFYMPKGGTISKFPDGQGLGTVKTVSLAYDRANDILYAGTYGNGLAMIDPSQKKVTKTICEDMNKWVSTLYLDSSGTLWVGTFNGPLCYDNRVGRLVGYSDQNDILKARVYCFCEGSDSGMWIGTGEGLVSFNRTSGSTKVYSEQDGLSSNVVCAILRSSDGNIWISTSHGLSRLNPQSGVFTRFYSYDGLQEDEFHYRAATITSDGMMAFGGINGLTIFYPQVVDQQTHQVAPVYFTRLTVMDKVIQYDENSEDNILDKNITRATSITLPHSDNLFTLEFAALEYTNPFKMRYAYKMDRLSSDWLQAQGGSATFTNLPQGRYTLTVKAYMEGDEEKFSTRSIGIRILPPWYLSPLAYLFYALLLASGIYVLLSHFKREKKREQEREESKIKELKLEMFTNISHEIRTPLNLVMSPLKKMREAETDSEKKDLYNLMYRNCLRVMRLVNQIMDMRKIDSGMMEFHFRETDIVFFIKDIMKSFDNSAKTKNIDFAFSTEKSEQNLWIDQGNFDKIIFNILSNAFKYTPDGGKISVSVSSPKKNEGQVESGIQSFVQVDLFNSGSHIDEKYIDKVFERFFQTDLLDAKVGSGVGLSLAKMLARLHHGDITVRNEGDGVTFSVYVPVGNSHLSEEEMSSTSHHKDLYTKSSFAEQLIDSREDLTYTPGENPVDKVIKSKKSIVIVDDEGEMRDYMKMELKGSFNVIAAENGESAWSIISSSLPDAVVTDLVMDGMDGIELCKKIKGNPSTSLIPVIILTSQGDDLTAQRCTEAGADAFLTKPVSMNFLGSTISNAISTRETIRNRISSEINYDYDEISMASRSSQLLNSIIDVIKKNLDNPDFSVEDLSREVGISRVHMNRKLKESINISPSKLIKSMRLKQAAYLLVNNEVNVSEVAYRVGFSSPSYFSNAFREYYGMTPKDFTNKYQNCKDEEILAKLFKK